VFTYTQLKQIARLLEIDYHADPAELNFRQYLSIFQFYAGFESKNLSLIRGAEARLHRQQAGMVKTHRTRKKRIIR
jgi:hypothetical protein